MLTVEQCRGFFLCLSEIFDRDNCKKICWDNSFLDYKLVNPFNQHQYIITNVTDLQNIYRELRRNKYFKRSSFQPSFKGLHTRFLLRKDIIHISLIECLQKVDIKRILDETEYYAF